MPQSMRSVTLDIPEGVYRDFEDQAKRENRTATDLMCQALVAYDRHGLRRKGSLRDLAPLDLGGVLQPLTSDDDLLEKMLDAQGN